MSGGIIRTMLLVVSGFLLAGCVVEPGSSGTTAPPPTTQVATPTPLSSPSPSPGTSATAQSPEGAQLRITVSATTLQVGQALTVSQVVSNLGGEALNVNDQQCGGPALIEVELPFPTTPTGAILSGPQATFKQWMLDHAYNSGTTYSPTYRTSFGPHDCGGGLHQTALVPGEQLTGSRSEPLTQIQGVTLPGGPATIVATLQYWPVPAVLITPGPSVHPGLFVPPTVSVSIPISVVGSAPHVLSAGQAVDAALASPDFGAFVAANSSDSWEIGILKLNDYGWTVELHLKSGALAMVRLDPLTGAVTWHRICANQYCN